MRTPAVGDAIRARAIAGTYAVLIALDATPAGRQGLMGFAIRRSGASDWMRGTKVFKSVIPAPDPKDDYSTLKQPLQTFLWGDYGVKPGQTYSYTIRPLYGTPGTLKAGPDVTLDVKTEGEHDGTESGSTAAPSRAAPMRRSTRTRRRRIPAIRVTSRRGGSREVCSKPASSSSMAHRRARRCASPPMSSLMRRSSTR